MAVFRCDRECCSFVLQGGWFFGYGTSFGGPNSLLCVTSRQKLCAVARGTQGHPQAWWAWGADLLRRMPNIQNLELTVGSDSVNTQSKPRGNLGTLPARIDRIPKMELTQRCIHRAAIVLRLTSEIW